MAEVGWGHLDQEAVKVGKPYDIVNDFVEVPFSEACSDVYSSCTHAAHGMIYAKTDAKLWDLYPQNACVLMNARFDGTNGFPGGLIDAGEVPVAALNRECEEEIKLDLSNIGFDQKDHVISHHNKKKKLVTHFYAKEVTYNEYCAIERATLDAKEWGIETYGIIRVPLFSLGDKVRGFPVFLNNRFAGNAKDQLIITLRRRGILSEELLDSYLQAASKYEQDVHAVRQHNLPNEIKENSDSKCSNSIGK